MRPGGSSFVPKEDIVENTDSFEIHLAVTGLNKEDFKIELNDNYLTVSGERKFTNEKKERKNIPFYRNILRIIPVALSPCLRMLMAPKSTRRITTEFWNSPFRKTKKSIEANHQG